jgi:hypothetical protein
MKKILTALLVILFVAPLTYGQKPADTTKGDTHRFDKAEYLQATTTGQKKASNPVKGT